MSELALPEAVCFYLENGGLIAGVTRRGRPTEWGLPGGKIDDSETPAAAIIREVHEETGLYITDPRVIFVGVCPGEVTYRTTTFRATIIGGAIMRAEEGCRIGWVSWDKLLKGPFGAYNRALRAVVQP